MNRLARLFQRPKPETSAETIPCPRCLGKGHVDAEDIIRLQQQGKWRPGTCAYCNGKGIVPKAQLDKVAADATFLTTSLSEKERALVIDRTQLEGCPVNEYNRLWLEHTVSVLADWFGKETTRQRRILVPAPADFPFAYRGSEAAAHETLKIVAAQMEVPAETISLSFYEDPTREVSTGSPFNGKLYLHPAGEDRGAAGLYWGKAGDTDRYEIGLERSNLSDPEALIATLAHEIAHIKLLGENRLEKNNEPATDVTTILFGLGIFNANVAFRSYQNFHSRGWSSQGYLSQIQWGYGLALFAFIRDERSPDWIRYLTANVKSDFLRAEEFIVKNTELIFQD